MSKIKLLRKLCLIITLFAIGCSNNNSKPFQEVNLENVNYDPIKKITSANNEFGLKLFHKLYEKNNDDNILISPYSIVSAFNMTYFGADGETKDEMKKVFGFANISDEDLKNNLKNLLATLANKDEKVRIDIANSIWTNKNFKLKQDFKDINKNYLNAEVQSLDFDDPKAIETINKWISDKTSNKINKIIDSFEPLEVLMLINAVYFKGTWQEEFDKENNVKKSFNKLDGSITQKEFMTQKENYRYLKKDNFQAVTLPYGDGDFNLYIFLPKENDGLNDFLSRLNNENWKRWLSEMKYEDGSIVIPKFKIQYGPIILNERLQEMGLDNPFTVDSNFSKMHDCSELYISKVLHKTFMDVNEEGTEAAAVTAVTVKCNAKSNSFSFIADHPFFFAIANETTGSILFMGILTDPKQ